MALNTNKLKKMNTTSSFVPQEALEPDSYPSRVVQVVDLGLQPQRPYKGEEKAPRHSIMITYELTDAFMLDENGEELKDKPRWISERMPIYDLSSERATSTRRYNAIDKAGKFGGDFSKVLGLPCSVLLTVGKDQKGNDRNYVGDVSPVMRGLQVADLINEPKFFDLDEPNLNVFRSLPEWLQEVIKSNLEFKGSLLESLLDGEADTKNDDNEVLSQEEEKTVGQKETEDSDDDENPWD